MWEIINELQRRIEEISTRLAMVQSVGVETAQGLAKTWSDFGSGGGSSQLAYWAKSPHTGIVASTGDWPDIVPEPFGSDIYQDVGGTLTLVATDATVRWFFRDACGNDLLVPVQPNGDGTYDALAASCTAVVT